MAEAAARKSLSDKEAPRALAHAADRLIAAIERSGAPVCVGLDPVLERLPAPLRPARDGAAGAVAAMEEFSRRVLDAVAPQVPCVKFQSACFERYRHDGVAGLYRLIGEAHARGLEVILDAKRGDIGVSAEHYAAAAFEPTHERDQACADWLTVNSCLGRDAIAPLLRPGFGAFALVRTSNPGSDEIQAQRLATGETVAERVARIMAELGEAHLGQRGYSALGAVVAATKMNEASPLREIMPRQMFLVPGYGAQGGAGDDVRPCFQPGGRGAIVSASRSVIYAFESERDDWQLAIGEAAARLADEIGRVAGMR